METSGFFDAEYIEETGEPDLAYLAEEFANYFKLFIGNGIFGSPTNQLKVYAGDGLEVIVSAGWAFIEGYWYYNDSNKVLSIPSNISSMSRTDSVRLRWDSSKRKISAEYFSGDTTNIRDGSYYDLKLAEIVIPAAALQVQTADIKDTRTSESECGIVTSVLKVQTTEDLFNQYEAIFNQWFDTVKGQLTADMAVKLQNQIGTLQESIGDLSGLTTEEKENLVGSINEIANTLQALSKALTEGTVIVKSAEAAEALATPIKINGVSFDGSTDIEVKDATKLSLEGGTLDLKELGDFSANSTGTAAPGVGFKSKGQVYGYMAMSAKDGHLSRMDSSKTPHNLLEEGDVPNIVLATEEPETIEPNTIIMVYEV